MSESAGQLIKVLNYVFDASAGSNGAWNPMQGTAGGFQAVTLVNQLGIVYPSFSFNIDQHTFSTASQTIGVEQILVNGGSSGEADRARAASSNQQGLFAGTSASGNNRGAQVVAAVGNWSVNHVPTSNTQATISRAAANSGIRHICTSITATLSTVTAAISVNATLNLRDGASGAGTILWSCRLIIDTTGTVAFAPFCGIALSGLSIVGSAATAMTLEFAAAGGADTFETVAMTGYTPV